MPKEISTKKNIFVITFVHHDIKYTRRQKKNEYTATIVILTSRENIVISSKYRQPANVTLLVMHSIGAKIVVKL